MSCSADGGGTASFKIQLSKDLFDSGSVLVRIHSPCWEPQQQLRCFTATINPDRLRQSPYLWFHQSAATKRWRHCLQQSSIFFHPSLLSAHAHYARQRDKWCRTEDRKPKAVMLLCEWFIFSSFYCFSSIFVIQFVSLNCFNLKASAWWGIKSR